MVRGNRARAQRGRRERRVSTATLGATVVLGAQGLQASENQTDTGAETRAYVAALLSSDAASVLAVALDPNRVVPAGLELGDHPVLRSDEFASPPSAPSPIIYHALTAPEQLGLWDLVPRWAASPNVALVVGVHELPSPYARSIPLLRTADALLAPSDELATRLVSLLGVSAQRVWVLQGSGSADVDRTLAAYGAALRLCARRGDRADRRIWRRRGAPGAVPGTGSRLAIVTPLPPARSGVAFYSARLIEALASQIAVDVYREDGDSGNPFRAAQVRCLPARGFDWRWELTAPELPPLYCIGNSPHHVEAWHALMRQRGDLLLHDVQLAGLYEGLVKTGTITSAQLHERIRLIEGQTPEALGSTDVLMVGELVDRARRVYVHTEAGREMVLRKRPLREADVFVVPFAVPVRRQAHQPAEPEVVAAFGYVQCGSLLLAGAAEILARRPGVRVRIIGDAPRAGELEALRAIAGELGQEGQVEVVGWSDEEQYERELAQATVAIQLRRTPHGEMSASVADCLGAGLPVVVNEFGSVADLPADAVVRIPKHPTSHEVAEAAITLLGDPGRRAALSAAALAHAQANTAERAAEALLSLIKEEPRANA